MDTIPQSTQDGFRQAIVGLDDTEITADGADELWRMWTARREAGATDEVLVVLPPWYANNELDRRWPYLFAEVEYDADDKDAVLFVNSKMIDVNVIENEIWDDVTMTESLVAVDMTDSDYIDEQGKVWIPRSLMSVFEYRDQSSLTDTAADVGDD